LSTSSPTTVYGGATDYLEIYAQVLNNAGQHQQARDLARDALQRFPDSTWLFQFWIDSEYRLGTPPDQIVAAGRVFVDGVTGDDRRRAYAIYANALARMDRDDEAIEMYEMALHLGEKNTLVLGNYAVELAAVGRHADAIERWEQALKLAEDTREFAALQRQYVNYLLGAKQKAEAVRVAQLRFEPADVDMPASTPPGPAATGEAGGAPRT
jgi:tetratricopeptide (TPR) repeat protein